ncbi:MAG: PEP-CTERM sorting domain-containing protein [Gammaproteobacteria bacterium]|nr:PEP-CTERM sorting domain-containing protein [Gammaproteobacteria bacterium]
MNRLARASLAFGGTALLVLVVPARAEIYNGVDFPQGAASFADSVVSFSPGPGPGSAFLDPAQSLGIPDVTLTSGLACFQVPTPQNCKFTSLGDGGSLVLRFMDNVLTGSSLNGLADGFNDLWVVEVGVAESTNVEISTDGSSWTDVGDIVAGGGGSVGVFTYGFDIDAFGFDVNDAFTYVRLTDVLTDPDTSPQGADIDAVGAIQTVIPLPAGAWLLPAGLVLARWVRRRPRC